MRITHGKLINLLKSRGVVIEKFTRQYAYVASVDGHPYDDTDDEYLPNLCTLHPEPIRRDWEVVVWTPQSRQATCTLDDLIKRDPYPKIFVIKCLRTHTGLGLKESKLISDVNEQAWGDFHEMQQVRNTKFEDLPLIINDIERPRPLAELQRRFNEGV